MNPRALFPIDDYLREQREARERAWRELELKRAEEWQRCLGRRAAAPVPAPAPEPATPEDPTTARIKRLEVDE